MRLTIFLKFQKKTMFAILIHKKDTRYHSLCARNAIIMHSTGVPYASIVPLMPCLILAQWIVAIVVCSQLVATQDDYTNITCNASQVFVIESNHTYLLEDCKLQDDELLLPPFIYLGVNSALTQLENVSIVVRGGNVLPSLFLNDMSASQVIKNISIEVTNVSVRSSFTVVNRQTGLPASLSMFYVRGRATTMEGVRLIINRCNIELNINVSIISAVNLLFHLDNGNRDFGTSQILDFRISVGEYSNISVQAQSSALLTGFGLVGLAFDSQSSANGITFSVVDGSSLSMLIDMRGVAPPFQAFEPALFSIECHWRNSQRCSISNVNASFIPAASSAAINSIVPSAVTDTGHISLQMLFPARANVTDYVALARITQFFSANNILLSLDAAKVVLQCACAGSGCGLSSIGSNVRDGDLSARIFYVRGTNPDSGFESDIANVTLQFLSSASASSIVLDVSKTGVLGVVGYAREVRNVSLLFQSPHWWNVTIIGHGSGVGQATRNLGIVEVSSVTSALDVAVSMENINLDTFALTQDCMVITTPAVSFIGNISQVDIQVTNVTMFANVSGGATYVFSEIVEFFTILSTLVNIIAQDETVLTGRRFIINISHSAIHACHTSNRPLVPVSPIFTAAFGGPLVASVIAALNIPRSLRDCVFEVDDVVVNRQFPESAGPRSWFIPQELNSEGSILVNVTAMLAVRDPMTTAVGASTNTFLKSAASQALGNSSTSLLNIAFYNMTIVARHCGVRYDSRLLSAIAGGSDSTTKSVEVLTLYLLPWLMNNTMLHTTDCVAPPSITTRRYSFGAFISLMLSTYMENTTLAFSNVSLGFSALLELTYQGTLTMVYGGATMQFVNVTVEGRESATQQQQQHAVIIADNGANISVSQPGNIIATLSPSTSLTMAPLYVSHSSFRNFGTLLPLDVWLAPSPEVRGGTTPYIQLGCNLWNDAPMAPRVLMTTTNNSQYIDMSSVSYPMSRYNASVTCDGLSTATSSEDESIPPAASASITVVIGTVGGVLSSAAMLDAQGLAVLGLSESCSPPTLREASASASQYLISPFYSLGIAAIVFGNLGLFVVLHGTHRVLVALLRKRQVQAKPMTLFSQMGENSSLVPFKATQPSIPIPLRPEVAYKFPNHSILVATMLAPGVVHGGTRGLFSGDVLSTTAGIVAAFVLAAGVWWRVRAGRSRDATKLKYVPYKYAVLRSAAVPHYALPLGQWGPPAARATHGRLRGAIRSGCEWLSAQSLCVGLVVQVVASIPVPTSWCVGLWFLLSLVQVVGAAIVIAFRPARAPLSDWLQVCGYGFAAALQIIVGLTSMEVLDQQDGATLSALSLCVMAVSACKACHAGVVFMWEQRQERHAAMDTGPLAVTDIPMMMTASSRRALRSAPIMMNIRIREALKELVVAACAKAQQKDEKNICMSEV